MRRAWKVSLILAAMLLLAMSVSMAWSEPQSDKLPKFTAKDRELIGNYYTHQLGTLAPGSLDRSGYPAEIERLLVVGSHVPMRIEKDLDLLPTKLESELSTGGGEYRPYKLGRHIVLVRKPDLTIADIMKNVAPKESIK